MPLPCDSSSSSSCFSPASPRIKTQQCTQIHSDLITTSIWLYFLVRSTNAPKFQPYGFSQILEGEIKASFLPPRSAAPVLAMRSGSLYLTPGEYSLLSCSPLDLSTCWRLIARRKKQSGASRNKRHCSQMPGGRSAERCCRLVVRTWRRIERCAAAAWWREEKKKKKNSLTRLQPATIKVCKAKMKRAELHHSCSFPPRLWSWDMDVQSRITELLGLQMKHSGVALSFPCSQKVVGMVVNAAQCKEYFHGYTEGDEWQNAGDTTCVFHVVSHAMIPKKSTTVLLKNRWNATTP